MVYFLLPLVWCVVWGFVTQKVIENKGYEENWFWWGFLFSVFALIVACAKPPQILEDILEQLAKQNRVKTKTGATATSTHADWSNAQEREKFIQKMGSHSPEELQFIADNQKDQYSEEEMKCIQYLLYSKKENS